MEESQGGKRSALGCSAGLGTGAKGANPAGLALRARGLPGGVQVESGARRKAPWCRLPDRRAEADTTRKGAEGRSAKPGQAHQAPKTL